MSSVKILLLLCYEFPPYPSIGGRRWVKFAKFLARNSFNVQVTAAEHPSLPNTEANWHKNIAHPNIQVHYLQSHYPYAIFQRSNTLYKRIIRKGYSSLLKSIK